MNDDFSDIQLLHEQLSERWLNSEKVTPEAIHKLIQTGLQKSHKIGDIEDRQKLRYILRLWGSRLRSLGGEFPDIDVDHPSRRPDHILARRQHTGTLRREVVEPEREPALDVSDMGYRDEISYMNVEYSHTIGRGEQFGLRFTQPVFIARGEGDLMYVLCRGSEYRPEGMRIIVCTVGGEYVTAFARGVSQHGLHEVNLEDGSLAWPTSIAIDRDKNVYVSDELTNRISIFNKDGDYLGKWEERAGDGDGELNRPSGMKFDADNHLYIVDSGNNRIQKFTKDGQFLSKWGSAGSGNGEFNLPWGIDLDAQGDVYIADWRNDRIQKFTPDGDFLMAFGSSGSGEGEFNRPSDVAVDNDGVIYVTDWRNDRLQVFDSDGNFVTMLTGNATVSQWDKAMLDANAAMGEKHAYGIERVKQFWGPVGVTVDDENRIFVCEHVYNRVQVYRRMVPSDAPSIVGKNDTERLL